MNIKRLIFTFICWLLIGIPFIKAYDGSKTSPEEMETFTDLGYGNYNDYYLNVEIKENLVLAQSDLYPTRYQIKNWGKNGEPFRFTFQEDGNILVDNQFTGYTQSLYGDIFVDDLMDYFKRIDYGESYYDAESGTFYFAVVYYVSKGYFGYGYETFTLSDGCKDTFNEKQGFFKEVDGIGYIMNKEAKTASVVMFKENKYSGSITIHSSFTYNGTTYSVTSIGRQAFYGCSSVTSVTIPNSVTSIGNNAFYGCKLENVLAKNPTTKSEYAFSDRTYQHAMCYVPEGTWGIAVYDGDWYRFNNIRELAMGKDALSSQKVYTMMETQSFSYVIYDGASNEAKMVKAFYNVDEEDPNNNWQIIEHAGNTYLYNIGAKQYACLTEDGKIALTATATPIELYDGENGVVLGSNSSSQWGFVVNKAFGTGETSIVLPTDGSNQNAVYYGLDGQQLSSLRKGLNIVKNENGKTKKIFVK